MSSFNPRPSSFMGVLAWAATEARLKGVPFCPLAGERVGGCAVEWLSRSFDAMSPTHKFDVEVTDLATGVHTTFSVIRKQRTYRKTGKTTVRYNTPIGNFGTWDEVNAALVAEALAAARAEGEGEVAEEVQAVAYPVVGVDVLAGLSLGRTQQIEQQHYAGAVAEVSEAVGALWEIINPSDPYTLRAPSFLDAAVATMLLGEGRYGLCEVEGERTMPVFILSDPDAWTREAFGTSLEDTLARGKERIVEVLESVMIGPVSARQAYETALRHLPEEKREAYRAEVHDQQRSSMNNIGARAWRLAEHFRAAQDGPHAQPEQQQAQALAVAVAPFEPECDRCGALLNERGGCPVCTPRWQPCETGVRHAQTIPATRDLAYREHEKAHAAAHAARKQRAEPARQRRLDEASQDAWTAYRRWVDADSFAAQAGAHDHLRWADL